MRDRPWSAPRICSTRSRRPSSAEPTWSAFAACEIGGTSLFGGRGSAWAAVLGALVVGAINNGLYLFGFNSDAQQIITALVLLTAVVVDALSRRGHRYVGRGQRTGRHVATCAGPVGLNQSKPETGGA